MQGLTGHAGEFGAEHGADPGVDPDAAVGEPLAEGDLDEEPGDPATRREAVLPTSQRHSMSSVPNVVNAQWQAARTALVATLQWRRGGRSSSRSRRR